jgi:hypothetical protein
MNVPQQLLTPIYIREENIIRLFIAGLSPENIKLNGSRELNNKSDIYECFLNIDTSIPFYLLNPETNKIEQTQSLSIALSPDEYSSLKTATIQYNSGAIIITMNDTLDDNIDLHFSKE